MTNLRTMRGAAAVAMGVAWVTLSHATSAFLLDAYYVKYRSPLADEPASVLVAPNPIIVAGPAPLRIVPPAMVGDITQFFQLRNMGNGTIELWQPSLATRLHDPCRDQTVTKIRPSALVSNTVYETNAWRQGPVNASYCVPPDDWGWTVDPRPPSDPIRWTLEDKITFNTPVRRKALDGGEFDASPMVIERAGNPWITYYWGYKLGLVESQSDWNDANRSKMPADWPVFPAAEDNFKLTTLPPPWVEGEVTEYVNTTDFPKQPDGQYFYAATDEDRAALDAVPAWQRTGNRFKHGGYVSVCRFYGGKNGGPNTHFYSASDTECNWLKGFSFLSYEGQTFRVNLPLPLAANAPPGTQPSCPAGSIPLYRLYNNAGAPGKTYVSNHRYVTTRSAVDAAAAKGWLDEGTVMCVPQ